MGPVPVSFSTTLLPALVVPTTCEEKERDVGVTEAAGAVPTPARVTLCVAPALPESSVTVTTPSTGPGADGVNETLTVQFDPAASWVGQASVSANPPLAEMFDKFSGLPPKFEIVTGCEGLDVPTFWEKVNVAGERLIAEGRGLGKGIGVTPKT